jgi:hypothetical protein
VKSLLVIAVVAFTPAVAFAGYCDEDHAEEVLKQIEKYAADAKAGAPEVWGLCMDQVITVIEPKTKRFLAACEKILARDRKFGVCVKWPIDLGNKQLGKIELFDLVEEAFVMDPLVWDTEPPKLYIRLDDPRAMPKLIDGWRKQLASKTQPKASWQVQPWTRFRRGTAKFLGKHGGAAEKAFLEEQLAVTKDGDVKRSIKDAIAAIDKRATKAP